MTVQDVLLRIAALRSEQHLSARELSGRIGMSSQYCNQLEHGKITLSVDKLLSILEVCGTTPERFFYHDVSQYDVDRELLDLLNVMPKAKKEALLAFLKTN